MMWYMRFPEGKAKALTLSYADGVRQDRKLIEYAKDFAESICDRVSKLFYVWDHI